MFNGRGGTCFESSICLRQPLRLKSSPSCAAKIFIYTPDKLYKKDVNRNNPLGMGGKMAEEVAEIMRRLWKEAPTSFSPSNFRVSVDGLRRYCVDLSRPSMKFFIDVCHYFCSVACAVFCGGELKSTPRYFYLCCWLEFFAKFIAK